MALPPTEVFPPQWMVSNVEPFYLAIVPAFFLISTFDFLFSPPSADAPAAKKSVLSVKSVAQNQSNAHIVRSENPKI